MANLPADSISGPPGSRLLNESEVQTRRGKVRVWTFKPLNGRHSHYTYFVMIGRPEGTVYTRSQYRDARYGYKWTSWRPTSAAAVAEMLPKGPRNWRLPA